MRALPAGGARAGAKLSGNAAAMPVKRRANGQRSSIHPAATNATPNHQDGGATRHSAKAGSAAATRAGQARSYSHAAHLPRFGRWHPRRNHPIVMDQVIAAFLPCASAYTSGDRLRDAAGLRIETLA